MRDDCGWEHAEAKRVFEDRAPALRCLTARLSPFKAEVEILESLSQAVLPVGQGQVGKNPLREPVVRFYLYPEAFGERRRRVARSREWTRHNASYPGFRKRLREGARGILSIWSQGRVRLLSGRVGVPDQV